MLFLFDSSKPLLATDQNLLAALGDSEDLVNLQTALGAPGWTVRGMGTDVSGDLPVFWCQNTNTMEQATFRNGNYGTPVVNRSLLKAGTNDCLRGLGNEVSTYIHQITSTRIVEGIIFHHLNVLEYVSGDANLITSYVNRFMALAYSTDYGATFQLAQKVGGGAYITPIGSGTNGTGVAWSLTVEQAPLRSAPTRIRIHMASYHPNPGSPGAEVWRCDFTRTAVGQPWTALQLRQIFTVTRSGGHMHSAIGGLIFIGDTAQNQTLQYTVDGGYDNYETGAITTTTVEAQGFGTQPVAGSLDYNGEVIAAPDNSPGVVVHWNSQGYFGQRGQIAPTMQYGGNEGLWLDAWRPGRSDGMYICSYRHTAGLSRPATSQRQWVSPDGVNWGCVDMQTFSNSTPNLMPFVTGTHMYWVESEILKRAPLTLIKKPLNTIVRATPANTNIIAGRSFAAAGFGDATWRLCPFTGGVHFWPTGTAKAGQPLDPQPPSDAPCYHITGRNTVGDDGTLDTTGASVPAGGVSCRIWVANASETTPPEIYDVTCQFRAVGAGVPAVTFSRLQREGRIATLYNNHSGGALRWWMGANTSKNFFLQVQGAYNGAYPPGAHSWATSSIAANLYTLDASSVSSALVVARLAGDVDGYYLANWTLGAVTLMEAEFNTDNKFRLLYTPGGSVTAAGTLALQEILGGAVTNEVTASFYLNNVEDITFAFNKNGGSSFALVNVSGVVLELTSADVFPVNIKAGYVATDILHTSTGRDYAEELTLFRRHVLQMNLENSDTNTASIINAPAMRDIMLTGASRMFDIISNCDSNGLFEGYGWDHGWQEALLGWFGAGTMYGSGIHAFGENGGIGQGVGYAGTSDAQRIAARNGGSQGMAADVNIPAALKAYWDSRLDPATHSANHLTPSIWLSRTDPASDQAKLHGLSVGASNPLGLANIDYQLWAAKFNNVEWPSGAVASIWQVNGGANQTPSGNYVCTDSGATRVPSVPFVMAGTTQTAGFEYRRQDPAATATNAYPFAGFFQRLVKRNQTTGFAVSMGYSVGSSTTTNCLNYWNAMGATRLANHIAAVCYQQTAKSQAPYLLVDFCFGVNDITAGLSAATFKSNLEALIALYRTAWASLGYSSDARLRFCLRVSHPTQAGDANLNDYRVACGQIAQANSDVSFVNMNSITNYTELNTAGIPQHNAIGSDVFHLETTAYNNDSYATLCSRILTEVFS